jgi:hypothetical protein
MKKLNKFIIFLLFTSGIILSCSDEYLDIKPINKLSESDFWQTDQDALQGLNAAYDILQWMYARDWNSTYLVKTLPSDESRAGGGDAGDQPPYQELDLFTYSAANTAVTAAFQSNYYGIYRANKVIDKVTPDNDLRKRIIAEAKCLRAYYYFELVSMFGEVPLILHELAPTEYSQPRAKKVDIYNRIENDLREAYPVLPLKKDIAADQKFRVSRGTAQALLGKAYLYQEKWDSAAYFLDLVIQSNEYGLADYSKLFLKDEENGIESLLEAVYSSTEGYTWGTFQWGGSRAMENNVHWQLMGPRGDYFTGGNSGLIGGWGFNYPSNSLYQAFVAAGDTVRRKATVMSEAELVAKGGSWTGQTSWGYDGCFRIKYGTIASETNLSPTVTPELNYGTNLRLIRYADVLLMAAEAYYRLTNEDRARTELNKVRTRANLTTIDNTVTGSALFNAIVNERELELAFEGVRFLDLIRWGLAPTVLGPKGFVTGKHELYPIPKAEMDNNKKITQNNPGF